MLQDRKLVLSTPLFLWRIHEGTRQCLWQQAFQLCQCNCHHLLQLGHNGMSLTKQELWSLASLKLKWLPYIQKLWGKQRTVRCGYRTGRPGGMNDSLNCSLTAMSRVSFSAIKRPQWLRMSSWSDRTYSTRSSSWLYCSLASFNCRGYSMRPQ